MSGDLRDPCGECGHLRAAHSGQGGVCMYSMGADQATCACAGFEEAEPARVTPINAEEPTPWPPRVSLVREKGETKLQLPHPGKESKTGGWEYQDYMPVPPRNDSIREDPASALPTGPGGIFSHGTLYAFDNDELDRILFEVAGAVSGVFLKMDPHLVMPAAEVELAVRDWVRAEDKGDCWGRAQRLADAADIEERRLNSRTIILMAPEGEYPPGFMANFDVVIDRNGIVIKNRHSGGGWFGTIYAGEELLEEAIPMFPPDWERSNVESLFPEPDYDPKLAHGDANREFRENASRHWDAQHQTRVQNLILAVAVAALLVSAVAIFLAVAS